MDHTVNENSARAMVLGDASRQTDRSTETEPRRSSSRTAHTQVQQAHHVFGGLVLNGRLATYQLPDTVSYPHTAGTFFSKKKTEPRGAIDNCRKSSQASAKTTAALPRELCAVNPRVPGAVLRATALLRYFCVSSPHGTLAVRPW